MRLSTDMADLSVLAGLMLIAVSLHLAFGLVASLAFVGAVMVMFGLLYALRGGERK